MQFPSLKRFLNKLIMPFKYLKFSEKERDIIKECLNANSNSKNRWLFSNLLVPFLLITLTIILTTIVRFSQETESYSILQNKFWDVIYNALKEVIFTGGITLIGINTLTIMSGYLIGTKKEKEFDDSLDDLHKPKKTVLNSIREKLHDFSYPLLIIGSFVYVIQIIYKPSSFWIFLLFLIIIIAVLKLSLSYALQMYITKDDFFLKTYPRTISDQVQDNVQNHRKELDNDEDE